MPGRKSSSSTDMSAHHDIPVLDRAGLRKFGLTTGGIVGGLFGLVLPYVFGLPFPRWPWFVLGVLGAWALVHPASLGPVYYYWMRFGLLLNKITTPIVLGLLFYIVLAPFGLIRGLLGRDSMARKLDAESDSYRVASAATERDNLENPY